MIVKDLFASVRGTVKFKPIHEKNWRPDYYQCGYCNHWITPQSDRYCSWCGMAIEHEEGDLVAEL